MSRCKSCGAQIVWVKTDSGKRMPVDAEPSEDGNVFVADDGPLRTGCLVIVLGQPDLLTDPDVRHKSHFATCPDADSHRSKR